MPHFCECGADTYICQSCAKILCSRDFPPKWIDTKYWVDVNTHQERPIKGNVCPTCMSGGVMIVEQKEGKVRLIIDQLCWDKKNQTFSQQVSSLGLKGRQILGTLAIYNPKTHTTVYFKYDRTDKSDSETDIAGWWYDSVGFPKQLKLLLIND